jgi:hypothetical protein
VDFLLVAVDYFTIVSETLANSGIGSSVGVDPGSLKSARFVRMLRLLKLLRFFRMLRLVRMFFKVFAKERTKAIMTRRRDATLSTHNTESVWRVRRGDTEALERYPDDSVDEEIRTAWARLMKWAETQAAARGRGGSVSARGSGRGGGSVDEGAVSKISSHLSALATLSKKVLRKDKIKEAKQLQRKRLIRGGNGLTRPAGFGEVGGEPISFFSSTHDLCKVQQAKGDSGSVLVVVVPTFPTTRPPSGRSGKRVAHPPPPPPLCNRQYFGSAVGMYFWVSQCFVAVFLVLLVVQLPTIYYFGEADARVNVSTNYLQTKAQFSHDDRLYGTAGR